AIEALRQTLSPDDFRREALGVWDDLGGGWVIPRDAWEAAADETALRDESRPAAWAVDISPARSAAAVAVAYFLEDGRKRVEVVRHDHGTGWVVPWLSAPQRAEGRLLTALD